MNTVGTALIDMLETLGTEYVFGIPGVHTVELYRGLASSSIRHITPRHEQGAGFAADGYARVSGKPGVCFVITGPGLTNTITAMAQALQDSIPMLVISGVNPAETHGKNMGLLHELPDQQAMIRTLTPHSYSLRRPEDLPGILTRAFEYFATERPGPVHIEVPTDLMAKAMPDYALALPNPNPPIAAPEDLTRAARLINGAEQPLILAGGGIRDAGAAVLDFARMVGAPVISTVNARAALGQDPLHVAASASLPLLREAMAKADLIIALGTEIGQTDYDLYFDGGMPGFAQLIQVDIDPARLAQPPHCDVALLGRVAETLDALTPLVVDPAPEAETRAAHLLSAAAKEVAADMGHELDVLDALVAALPECIIVGDSTQAVYAGNFVHRGALPKGWFNAATGYGTLGYAPGAAIGAALAAPGQPVICLIGDGGMQFSLGELAMAADAGVNVTFLIWNNAAYLEIETYMVNHQISPVGVRPSPPDFQALARAFGLDYGRAESPADLAATLGAFQGGGPKLLEYAVLEGGGED